MVDADKCNSCGWCIEASNYGAIMLHPDRKVTYLSDLCDNNPKCVERCPEEALDFVTAEIFAQKTRISTIEKIFQEIKNDPY
jgi:Fe-S-cluster-containing hydrogenase component 2